MRSGRVIAAVAAIFTALALVSVASAQYPPPQGSLECTTEVSVKLDGQTKVGATLRDSSGNPVAGETVQFSVLAGDASLSATSAVTDASGMAMVALYAGSNPGNISVSAVYDGLECRAVSQVAGVVVSPPNTGDAGLLAQHETSTGLMVLVIVSLGLVTGALWVRYSAQTGSN